MKKILLLLTLVANIALAQTQTPDVLWGQLFKDVQLTKAMGDNKTFVDLVPMYAPADILKKYATLPTKDSLSIRNFVFANFYLPKNPAVNISKDVSLKDHLEELWNALTRQKDSIRKNSSLLPLPGAYIVPGGRFREIYYWDSYFTMLGLIESKRYDLVEDMLNNFKYLIDTYGHIPNGNRNYYLSRSQPPFFALMVDLLAQKKGDAVYRKYFSALQKEYAWWMNGEKSIKNGSAQRRVVKLDDGTVLNRYYDDKKAPREESYVQDVTTFGETHDSVTFTNLRAGAESGWDFSSRWFGDTLHLSTVETTNILPVDLNCLLYAYESILGRAAKVSGAVSKSADYKQRADKRKTAIQKYFWNDKEHFYFDYNFVKKQTTNKWAAAGAMPLFANVATKQQAALIQQNIQDKLLKPGGIATTVYHTGQQWDAPNGWAPLQYITVQGLNNYGYDSLAQNIAERWMSVNERVFATTGKMLEKYNVENINLESGGGEYPTQDGFGWSNGVYLKFHSMYKLHQPNQRPFRAF